MGTVARITLYGESKDLPEAFAAGFSEMQEIDLLMSNYRPDSEITRLNLSSGGGSMVLDPRVFDCLARARRYAEMSHGAFDPTVEPLVRAYGWYDHRPSVPTDEELRNLLPRVGYECLRLDERKRGAALEVPGAGVDVGGIAKGYAVDLAVRAIKRAGVDKGLVEISGNTRFFGSGAKAWRVGIEHPRREGELIGTIAIGDLAVSTSGDYRRSFTVNGRRYHHILDPHSGMPAKGVASVTVVARTATEADALSTAVFVLGPVEGFTLLRKVPGAEALLVSEDENGDLELHRTPEFPPLTISRADDAAERKATHHEHDIRANPATALIGRGTQRTSGAGVSRPLGPIGTRK